MDEKLLEEIGLTKGEIRVYLSLLKLGETTTGQIIHKSGISAGKVYDILEKLIQKGLASFILKEQTRHYSAASPKRILDYVDEKESDLLKKKEKILAALPELMAPFSEAVKEYDTRLFVGFKGIETAIFEALQEYQGNDDIIITGVKLSRDKKFNIMWKKWHAERIARKIPAKIIFSEKDNEFFKIFSSMKFSEAKINLSSSPSSIGILGDRVLLTTYSENSSCLSIKHPEIALTLANCFWTEWKAAKQIL